MRFLYEGFTKLAQIKRGFVDAKDIGEAAEILRGHGLSVQNLQPESSGTLRSVLEGGETLNFPEVATQAPPKGTDGDAGMIGPTGFPGVARSTATTVEVKPDDKDYKWKNDIKKEIEAGQAKHEAAKIVLQYIKEIGVPFPQTDMLLGMIEEEIREKQVAAINKAIKERARLR